MVAFVVTLWQLLRSLGRSLKDPEFQVLFFLVAVTFLSGTIFYHNVEGWSLLNSFYFCPITLTTVGYGDLSPATDVGKLFTVLYLFIGIGLILVFVNAIAQRMVDVRGERRRQLGERRRQRVGEPESQVDARTSSRRSGYPPGTSRGQDP